MTNYRVASLVAIVAAGVAAAGCGGGNFSDSGEPVATAGSEPLVDWETYRASVRMLPGEGFLAEFDLLFRAETALYQHWRENYGGSDGQPLTVHTTNVNGVTVDDIWPIPQRFDITYCVSSAFTEPQTTVLLQALDEATAIWSRFLAVEFRRVTVSGVCDEFNDTVLFNVKPATFTNANYPSVARELRVLNLDNQGAENAFVPNAYGTDLLGVLLHELGHILGLVHEHKWNASCPAQPIDANTPARQLTEYDQMSVMNYPIPGCRDPAGGGFHISPLDVAGTVNLYGLAPALVATVAADLAP